MDTKDWESIQKFIGPQDKLCRDHLARTWGALLVKPLTQQSFHQVSVDIKSTKISTPNLISHWQLSILSTASTHVLKSDSTMTLERPCAIASCPAYIIASVSAWRGRMVSTFLEKAKTSFPLQSQATTAIDEKWGPTAASQLILMIPKLGQTHTSFPLEI